MRIKHRVKHSAWHPLLAGHRKKLQRLLVLTREARPNLPPQLDLNIIWTDNAAVQTLNAQWRGKDQPTNILSFPAGYLDKTPDFLTVIPLGDLVLAHEIIISEAAALAISPLAHIKHLLVHGTLHLLGLTHADEADMAVMHEWEIKILAKAGHPNPYLPYVNDE